MTLIQTVEADVLALVSTELTTNQAAVEAFLASGEADVTAGLANLIKNIPSIKGLLGTVANPIEAAVEAAVEAYVAGLVAKETPASLFALLQSFIAQLQKQV